jgi:hypothetical protein
MGAKFISTCSAEVPQSSWHGGAWIQAVERYPLKTVHARYARPQRPDSFKTS